MLGVILGDVRVQIALATLAISQFVMIATTSTSPLYLHDQGHAVRTIGLAVSLHLGGMYIASPLSGWLCDRVGRLPMIGVGGLPVGVQLMGQQHEDARITALARWMLGAISPVAVS